jgi:hypothetical protein
VQRAADITLAMVLEHSFKQDLNNSTRSSLAILGNNLVPTDLFNDRDGATQLVRRLRPRGM